MGDSDEDLYDVDFTADEDDSATRNQENVHSAHPHPPPPAPSHVETAIEKDTASIHSVSLDGAGSDDYKLGYEDSDFEKDMTTAFGDALDIGTADRKTSETSQESNGVSHGPTTHSSHGTHDNTKSTGNKSAVPNVHTATDDVKNGADEDDELEYYDDEGFEEHSGVHGAKSAKSDEQPKVASHHNASATGADDEDYSSDPYADDDFDSGSIGNRSGRSTLDSRPNNKSTGQHSPHKKKDVDESDDYEDEFEV